MGEIYTISASVTGAGRVDGAGNGDAAFLRVPGKYDLGEFTASMWVRPLSGGSCELFRARMAGDSPGLSVLPRLEYASGNVTGRHNGSPVAAPVGIGAWSHVAFIRGGGAARLFINGEAAGEAPANTSVVYADAYTVEIGGGNGKRVVDIFDFRLVHAAVSAESVKAYYDAVGRGGEGWLP
jgi:hypothetical protein